MNDGSHGNRAGKREVGGPVRKHQIPIAFGELTDLRKTGQQPRDQTLRRERVGSIDVYPADSDGRTHKPTEYQ